MICGSRELICLGKILAQDCRTFFKAGPRHVQAPFILFSAVHAYSWPYKAIDHELGIACHHLPLPRPSCRHTDSHQSAVKKEPSTSEFASIVESQDTISVIPAQ